MNDDGVGSKHLLYRLVRRSTLAAHVMRRHTQEDLVLGSLPRRYTPNAARYSYPSSAAAAR